MAVRRSAVRARVADESEQTSSAPRERILDAALDLFFRKGFQGTSVREITTACGLTPGALYNHFPSKEAVLFTLIMRAHDEGDRLLAGALEEAGSSPVDQLYAIVYTSATYHTHHRPAGLVAMFEYVELPEAERDIVIERRRRTRQVFERVLTEGVKKKVFSLPQVDGRREVKVTATAVMNIAVRMTEAFGPTPGWKDATVADFHAELALRMVGARRRS